MSYTNKFYPRRPVKSFQDLEVYQKVHALAVTVAKNMGKGSISQKLVKTALRLPKLIATAHSLRFGQPDLAVNTLEQAMLACNLAVVYLEQYRDLENKKVEVDFFEEQIKAYLRVRGQILRLQLSWKKFMKGGSHA